MLDEHAAKTDQGMTPGNVAERSEAYRYRRLALRTVLADMRFEAAAPQPGARIPAFELPTVDGTWFSSVDLAKTGPVLLVFGSLSCPMTDSAVPGLLELHRRHAGQVCFVMVNVREAHPGTALPQPQTAADKLVRAQQLRDLHGLPFEVAVDDVEGTFHRAMSAKPNSAYLIDRDGRIAFRAHWANDTAALAHALRAMTSGEVSRRRESGGLLLAMVRMFPHLAPVLDRAGAGAWGDMWRIMAPLAGMAMTAKLLGLAKPPACIGQVRPRRDRDAPT